MGDKDSINSDTFIKKIEESFLAERCFICKSRNSLEVLPFDQHKIFLCQRCRRNLEKEIPKESRRGMYGKFQAFLESIPQQQEQVALNFSDFTDIMGHDLPKTAYKDRTWWANTESPQGGSWLSAGWKLDSIYLSAKIVIFRRKGENPLKSIPKYLKAIFDDGAHVVPPSAHVLSSWIRFCRKIGWYFEGKVLYERGGLSLDSLNETDRAEVDENYAACKRELMRYKNEKNA